ncbi:MAG TPA: GAF domain-containing protein, partial [Thermodesulfobacteriota bacterium]|nr:GAF domain-containing protein [Thermodesulfobacteriota bacterium]
MEYKQSEMQSTINPSGAQSEMIRILLIEDNPGDAQLVQEMLNEAEGKTFRLERVDRLSEGLRLLTEEKFDLILLDLSLPDGQGLEMLEKVQACVRTTPVVLLTGTFEEEPIAIKALQSGAEDYLYKGNIDSKLLVRSVRYAIERKRAEEQQKILSTIMEAVHKSLDLEEVYNIALDMTVALENVDMAMIYLVDADRKETIVQAQRNIPEDYIRRAGRIPYPKGITWKVISSGEIMNIGDAQKDPEIGPAGRDLGHHGVLGIPVTLEGRTIGVIWFFSYKERKFSRHEVDFLSSIGNQVATAIAKAKLYR